MIVFQEIKFCMKDSACLAIQYCDKTILKVYGTCEVHSWFWVIIAVLVVLVLVVITGLLIFWLKKRFSRETARDLELAPREPLQPKPTESRRPATTARGPLAQSWGGGGER